MRTNPGKHKPKKRNPVAKAARTLRPKVVPDRRREKLRQAKQRETEEAMGEGE